eukprot:6298668-Lingulodinium_polyedra.AAC.1
MTANTSTNATSMLHAPTLLHQHIPFAGEARARALRMSDDDALRLIVAAAQTDGPAPPSPDDDLGVLLQAVAAIVPKEKYTQRGNLLCSHARLVKEHRKRARVQPVAPHITNRIQRFHADYAIREEDKIMIDQVKPEKQKGR